ncbi:Uncharacterised protein [Mycobacteroides abscessus subsp. abscessus]|nr:Uncharacterised protein [Mycobacteroides abscessus subsp. abscessus]
MDRGDGLEEFCGLFDGHVEHLGDGLALVVHLERFPVVACAVAHLAGHVNIRQEVHLDLDGAVARARFAAATLDVEGEPARLITPHLGLCGRREERADLVENSGIGGRIRAGCAPDRRLIHPHQFVHLVQARHPGVPARHLARPVELVGQHSGEDVVDQSRLPRTRYAGNRGQHP